MDQLHLGDAREDAAEALGVVLEQRATEVECVLRDTAGVAGESLRPNHSNVRRRMSPTARTQSILSEGTSDVVFGMLQKYRDVTRRDSGTRVLARHSAARPTMPHSRALDGRPAQANGTAFGCEARAPRRLSSVTPERTGEAAMPGEQQRVASTMSEPQRLRQPASSARWFVAGLVVGAALALGAVGLGGNEAVGQRATDHAAASALAKLVARPLLLEGQSAPEPSDADALAVLDLVTDRVDALAKERSELAPIAREYGDALRALRPLLVERPSPEPLLRSGIDAWRAGMEDDGRGFFLALLGVGSELSRFGELMEKASIVHARVVACRLRLADVIARTAPPESTENTVTARFAESRGFFSIARDTLFLTNVAGKRLEQVAVVVELTGASGETFSNCFYADAWEPGQTLLAVCRSERPGRETVANVKRIRFRVLSSDRTSRLGELLF